MPSQKVDFKVLVDRHPEEVNEVLIKLRSGKSKEKNSKAEDLSWSYEWAEWIDGKEPEIDLTQKFSIKKYLQSQFSRIAIILRASKNRWHTRVKVDLPKGCVPIEIKKTLVDLARRKMHSVRYVKKHRDFLNNPKNMESS